MISSIFTLKEQTTIPDSLVSIQNTTLEESYFNSTLNFLLECQNEMLSYRQDLYKTLLEEDNPTIVNEAFNDILNGLKAAVKKILAYIETLVKRFVTQIAKFIQSDKYILINKKNIQKFTDDDKFKITGFEYTFKENIPVIDIPGLDLSELKQELKSIANVDITQKINKLDELNVRLNNNAVLDELRAQVLHLETPIPENSYANEAFCVYRDGESEEHTIHIKRANVLNSLNDYENYKDKIKIAERDKERIFKKYKEVQRQLDDISTSSMKSDGSRVTIKVGDGPEQDYSEEFKRKFNNAIMIQSSRIQAICNFHILAFAAKLDALNAATTQDRAILYAALSRVQSHIKNNTFVKEDLDLTIDSIKENYTSYDYTNELLYKNYVLEKHFMNLNQKRFINECLVLSESNIPVLKSIHEDLKMDQKNRFEKLKEIVKNIIEKFINKLTEFINRDKKFLENNKETILTKKVTPAYTLNNMPAYSLGIKNINEWKEPTTPQFEKLMTMTEKDIQKIFLPAYDGNGEFVDFAKKYFISNNTEAKDRTSEDEEVSMSNLYNYCVEAPDNINKAKKDKSGYDRVVNSISAAMKNMKVNESYSEFGMNYILSTVLEMYINEADGDDKKSGVDIQGQNNNSSAESKGDAKLDLNTSKEDNNKDQSNNADKDPEDKEQDNKEEKSSNNKKAEETANWHIKAYQTVIGARLTAMQRIYSEYMKIIRYHVKALENPGDANSDEHSKNLKPLLKEYLDAGDDNDKKKAASDKIISYFKSKMSKTIDAHDVQILVNKNLSKLRK